MKDFLYQQQWGWKSGGIALAFVFLLGITLVKPVGVSAQFVILDGLIWDLFSADIVVEDASSKTTYASSNAYLNKSGGKYAKNIAEPMNYSFIFVLAMVAGGFAASKMQTSDTEIVDPPVVWQKKLGSSTAKRYLFAGLGGVLVLFGARLAGGCTSGHMMSGMMQTALSGYLFAFGAFAAAVVTAIFMYGRED
ncbi:MAG: YeeE/YedE family protein [Methyloprofundus sp.]|nr:YeeE/YedE family protein [Methyloprofundus sp.]